MLIMRVLAMTVSRWVTGKTRGTALKLLCLQKLSPNQLSCCLCWPCLAAQAHTQHCPLLPGRDCEAHHFCVSNGGSWKKNALTPPKRWVERLNVNIPIPMFTSLGQQLGSGPALLTYSVCSTIILSLFSNWVLDPFQEYWMGLFTQAVDCYPLSPMKLRKINIGI